MEAAESGMGPRRMRAEESSLMRELLLDVPLEPWGDS